MNIPILNHVKTNDIYPKTQFNRKYTNLSPLKRDTVSFKGNVTAPLKSENAVNLDWIDKNSVRKSIEKIKNNALLDKSEIIDLLAYFNYTYENTKGDDDIYKHVEDFGVPSYTLNANNKLKIGYTDSLARALGRINLTNGELFFSEKEPSEEEIEAFNQRTTNPKKELNPYRKKLEEQKRLEKEEATAEAEAKAKAEADAFDRAMNDRQMNMSICKSYISQAKEDFKVKLSNIQYCIGSQIEFIEEAKSKGGNVEQLEKLLKQSKELQAKAKKAVEELTFEKSDRWETIQEEKISLVNKKIDELYAGIDSLFNQAYEYASCVDKETSELIQERKEKIQQNLDLCAQIVAIFEEVKNEINNTNVVGGEKEYYNAALDLQKDINTKIRRPAKQICKKYTEENKQNKEFSLEELTADSKRLRIYLVTARRIKKDVEENLDSYNKSVIQKATEETEAPVSDELKPTTPVDIVEQVPLDDSLATEFIQTAIPQIVIDETTLPQATIEEIAPITIASEAIEEIAPTAIEQTPLPQKSEIKLSGFSKRIFDEIKNNLSKTQLSACADDTVKMLIEYIGEDKINSLSDSSKAEFVNFIQQAMGEISKTPQFKNNTRAMNIALLDEISLCSKDDIAKDIYLLSPKQTNELISGILAKKTNFTFQTQEGKELKISPNGSLEYDDVTEYYNKLKAPLTNEDIDELVETLLKYTPNIPKNKLRECLSNGAQYLMLINNSNVSNSLKTKLLKFIYKDFDKSNNTNFTHDLLLNINAEKINKEIKTLTDEIDWDNL